MGRAFVLMTAMPPTKGHLNLIKYAHELAGSVVVVVCTQPGEPYINERIDALRDATQYMDVSINHLHKELPQDPTASADFWPMWASFLHMYGIQPDRDIVVASEPYGKAVAEITGTKFFPFDIQRQLNSSRATNVRDNPLGQFKNILPEFQPYLRKTVTVFGAESTGKTTLSRELAFYVDGAWFFEYARPYLETVGTEITQDTMRDIWKGQQALQDFAQESAVDKPFIIQDTDLFSTVGYYRLWDGSAPEAIIYHALARKSDLYLITQSNIPFEQDPIRYGGDVRESDDQFWIDLCEEFGLNYQVLESQDRYGREIEAQVAVETFFTRNANIYYQREGQ